MTQGEFTTINHGLRDAGLATAPFRFTIRQGEAMGRPSVLKVTVPVEGGITVSGTAIDL